MKISVFSDVFDPTFVILIPALLFGCMGPNQSAGNVQSIFKGILAKRSKGL